MKTNTKEFNGRMETYIFECMDDIETYPKNMTETEKLQTLKDRFCTEYVFPAHLKRYGSIENVLKEWLSGLPTAFNLDYTYYQIFETCKKLHNFTDDKSYTEKQKDNMVNSWFAFMAHKIIQTAKNHGVDFLIN